MIINVKKKAEPKIELNKGRDFSIPLNVLDESAMTATNGIKLDIPTYDGSGQATHPDVAYFSEKWNGWHYWMCMTPYANSFNPLENPSVVVSDDGLNWVVPQDLTNPIVAPIGTAQNDDHHSDACFFFEDDTLYMFWRTVYKTLPGNNFEVIYVSSSTDGVNWTEQKEVATVGSEVEGYAHLLSPSVVKIDGVYYMYVVNDKDPLDNYKQSTVQYLTSETVDGIYSNPTDVILDGFPDSRYPWHVNVCQYQNTLIMTMIVRPKHDRIYIFKGNKPEQFKNPNGFQYLLTIREGEFDEKWLYQSALTPVFDKGKLAFNLYYGGVTHENEWGIGLTTVRFSE